MNEDLIMCGDALDAADVVGTRFKIIANLSALLYPGYKIVKRSCASDSLRIHVIHSSKTVFVIGRP